MTDETFISKLNKSEKRAWVAFVKVQKFLNSIKADDYHSWAFCTYEAFGCNMLLKIDISDYYLNFFPGNLGTWIRWACWKVLSFDIMQINADFTEKLTNRKTTK